MKLDSRAKVLRHKVIEVLASGGRGHLASALSLMEILRVLYDDILRFDPTDYDWRERDRLILSKGHGCLALYVLLADKGFFDPRLMDGFCGRDCRFGGHPERGQVPGVEACTGSLGHGLSLGLGMSLAARMDGSNRRIFVVLGDGECNEGAIWEAAMSAGKHGLDSLSVLVDHNKQQSYGSIREVQDMEPFADKWKAFGFVVREVDGHDIPALRQVLAQTPFEKGRPNAIICHTVKGAGIPTIEGDLAWHHKSSVSGEVVSRLLSDLNAAQCYTSGGD